MFLMNCDCMQPHIRGNKTVSSPVVGTFGVVWYWGGGRSESWKILDVALERMAPKNGRLGGPGRLIIGPASGKRAKGLACKTVDLDKFAGV